jgi:Spy/CpxP family protein refolding chaperone
MRRRIRPVVLCVAVVLGGPVSGGSAAPAAATPAEQAAVSQPPQRFAWWRSEQYQKNLGLTVDQVNRIETIFQNALPDLRKGRDELDREEAELSRLIEVNADEAKFVRQLDKVEALRSHLNKVRLLILYHHRQVLSADQRVRLKVLFDQAQADRNQRDRDKPARPQDEHKP